VGVFYHLAYFFFGRFAFGFGFDGGHLCGWVEDGLPCFALGVDGLGEGFVNGEEGKCLGLGGGEEAGKVDLQPLQSRYEGILFSEEGERTIAVIFGRLNALKCVKGHYGEPHEEEADTH